MVKRGLAFGGILAILSGVGIYSNIYAATEGTTKFSVDVNNAVLELTVPSNPAVIDLNPTMANASFGSTNINIRVATNNITGYTLTMTPTNNTEATSLIRTELIGDEEDYREIETLEITDPVSTGYTEQTFTTNAWGYKITGDNYYGIDPENTTVSHPAWTTSEPTNGTNHNLTLAAKVDAETVSGAYETTLNFRAVTNAVPLVTLEMSYGFHGKQKVTVDNEEYYKMQDMTTEICSYTNEIPSQLEVVDIRDNTIYHIAKLQDGRCWLQDNLALDPTDPIVKTNLSPDNTNASQAAITNFLNGGNPDSNDGWSTQAVSAEPTTSVYNQPQVWTTKKSIVPQGDNDPLKELSLQQGWKVGIYYNYCAASVGTYCYAVAWGKDTDKTSAIDIKNDVCPTGWRIPTGGPISSTGTNAGGGEYDAFLNAYKKASGFDYIAIRKALRLSFSSDHYNTDRLGEIGFYWSATYYDNSGMYHMQVDAAGVIKNERGRGTGQSIRCIAK